MNQYLLADWPLGFSGDLDRASWTLKLELAIYAVFFYSTVRT
jgi:hypothetical protein